MNPILANTLIGLASAGIGYFIGSVPTGVLVGKAFFHKDPREVGSHNSGGTNVARSFGKKYGVLVIILDMIKALIPVFTVWAVLNFTPLSDFVSWNVLVGNASIGGAPVYYWLAGLFAAIGHCWPIYIHFKGGKAVACFMGLNCLTSWIQFICSGFSYLYLAHKTKFISLTSIIVSGIGAVVAWSIFVIQVFVSPFSFNSSIFLWSFGFFPFPSYGLEYAIMDTIITILLVVRHRANIVRLKNHTESTNPFASK